MAMMDDEETQINGVVDIIYAVGANKFPTKVFEFVKHGGHICKNFSVRRCCLHVCYNDPRIQAFLGFARPIIPKETKTRRRFHNGSHMECQYGLRSYGITLPNSQSLARGEFVAVDPEAYIAARRKLDDEWKLKEANRPEIRYPQPNDILVGRGKAYQEFAGNLRLFSLVGEYVDEYSRLTDRQDKTLLSMKIVTHVQATGSRFLSRTDTGWKVVDSAGARQKVVQALRNRARKHRHEGDDPFADPFESSSKRSRIN